MVYAQALRKTVSFLVIAMALSLAIVVLTTTQLDAPIGYVTDAGTSYNGGSWIVFLLGSIVGALAIGTYTYLLHIEARRNE